MELDATVLSTLIAVVALGIAVWAIVKARSAGTPLTPQFLTATLESATVTAAELAEVALTAAGAAEQLYRTGKIEKSERLDHAFDYVKGWFPQLDQATIITAIESAVLTVNSIIASLPEKG